MELLGQILQKALKDAGISNAEAASYMGVSETNLYRLFKKDSFEVSYLKKAADLLNLPLSYFLGSTAPTNVVGNTVQTDNSNQAGNGNIQKIKGNKGNVQANTGTTINNIDDCRRDLIAAQKEVALLTSQLADKERIIQLLERSGK